MGSSSQKTRTSTTASGPGFGQLSQFGPERVEQQYQSDVNDPNRLAPQAQGYLGNVLQGNFLDPSSNPHLGNLTSSIWESVAPQVSSVFSRAGRGTSANNSGLGGALTRGFTSALAQPLFAQYGQERGLQQQAAQMAPAIDATQGLPLEQYLERMRNMATLAQQGTSKTTQRADPVQTIAGTALTAASLFSDRRLKADVTRIGDDPRGFGIYAYRYVWDEPGTVRTGVMAQEVAPIVPEAVGEHAGWLTVDYAAL